jgi:hypothetical protein
MPTTGFEPVIPENRRLKNSIDIMDIFQGGSDLKVVKKKSFHASVGYQISAIEPAYIAVLTLRSGILNSNLASPYFSY